MALTKEENRAVNSLMDSARKNLEDFRYNIKLARDKMDRCSIKQKAVIGLMGAGVDKLVALLITLKDELWAEQKI